MGAKKRSTRCIAGWRLVFLAVVTSGLVSWPIAHAYCIRNRGPQPITVMAEPINASSFCGVIESGEDKCCDWQNSSCVATVGTRDMVQTFRVYSGKKCFVKRDDHSQLDVAISMLAHAVQGVREESTTPPLRSQKQRHAYHRYRRALAALDHAIRTAPSKIKSAFLGVAWTYHDGDVEIWTDQVSVDHDVGHNYLQRYYVASPPLHFRACFPHDSRPCLEGGS